MHAVLAEVIDLDRQEGSGPDMERHGRSPDAACIECGHELFGEVETGSRCGNGTGPTREDRLVILAILRVRPVRALDIGRERGSAVALEGVEQGLAGTI